MCVCFPAGVTVPSASCRTWPFFTALAWVDEWRDGLGANSRPRATRTSDHVFPLGSVLQAPEVDESRLGDARVSRSSG